MTATRELAIIMAFVALWEVTFEKWQMFLVSLFSWIAKSMHCFHINFILNCPAWDLQTDQSQQKKLKCNIELNLQGTFQNLNLK